LGGKFVSDMRFDGLADAGRNFFSGSVFRDGTAVSGVPQNLVSSRKGIK